MGIVHGRARIRLPLQACWDKLRDLGLAKHYVPGVRAVEITTAQREGVGSSRRVTASIGPMDETVIDWREGEGFTLRLHRGDAPAPPFREATFRYALVPAGPHCEIRTTMEFALRGGAFGRLVERLLLRRILERNVRDVAVGLAHYYETGEPVPPGAVAELRRGALPVDELPCDEPDPCR